MATDPASYRPAPGTIPTEPGVYKFLDPSERVVYVGKAKNLRSRLMSYFQHLSLLHPRTQQMVTTASRVEWTVVATEVEALQLEYTWIKKFDPRFNVKYRDDKTYPVLAVSVGQRYPRAYFYRGPQRKGIRYFGPYSHAWAVRETLDVLIRIFPMRTCSQTVFNRHEALKRPCLLGYIDKCAAPCVGRVSETEHREIVDKLCHFMAGKTDDVIRGLEHDMLQAAESLDFEKAARLRDNLAAVRKITEQQAVVLGDGTDADVIAVEADELEASVQMFHVRGGRIRGQRGWIVERNDTTEEELADLLQNFLIKFYSDALEQENYMLASERKIIRRGVDNVADAGFQQKATEIIPREVLISIEPAALTHTQQALSLLRGSTVDIRVPQRGDKKALMETVWKNAVDALRQHKLKRAGDLTTRSAALKDIQDALYMADAPLRIECTDISHIQGNDVVASLVVFEDGLPKKSDYRRYKIQEAAGDGHSNDVASIAEVVRRRFMHHNVNASFVPSSTDDEDEVFQDEAIETPEMVREADTAPGRKFAYPPQLFIVDGGLPQVNAAQEVFDELGITDVVLVGIAKRLEELWLPNEEFPVILSRNSPGMFLIQHIRDEAHRFAITFHRSQRSKRMKRSVLDDIPGLGPKRRQELVKYFGSVKKLKAATIAEIEAVPGFGPQLARTIVEKLQQEQTSKP